MHGMGVVRVTTDKARQMIMIGPYATSVKLAVPIITRLSEII